MRMSKHNYSICLIVCFILFGVLWTNPVKAGFTLSSSFTDGINNVPGGNTDGSCYSDIEDWKNDFIAWQQELGVNELDNAYISSVNSWEMAEQLYNTYSSTIWDKGRNEHWGFTVKGLSGAGTEFYSKKTYSEILQIRLYARDHSIGTQGTWLYFQSSTSKCYGTMEIQQYNYSMDESIYTNWYNSAVWNGNEPAEPQSSSLINIGSYKSIYSNLNYKNDFSPDEIFYYDNTSALMNDHNAYFASSSSSFKLFFPPGVDYLIIRMEFPTKDCVPPYAPAPTSCSVNPEPYVTIGAISAEKVADNPVVYQFSATVKVDGETYEGNDYTYNWKSGTQTSTERTARFTFAESGYHTVELEVKNSSGQVKATASKTINITGATPITINSITTNPSFPDVNETVRFSASVTGTPTSFKWTIRANGIVQKELYGSAPSYSFTSEGDYTITLEVSDADGKMDDYLHNIYIASSSEISAVIKASIPDIDNPLNVQFTAVDTLGGAISGNYQYFWDFGVAGDSNDVSSISNPTYQYANGGTYNVTLTLNDNSNSVFNKNITLNHIKVFQMNGDNHTDLSIEIPVLFYSDKPGGNAVKFSLSLEYQPDQADMLWKLSDIDLLE